MKKSILISAAIVTLAMLASCQKEQFTENAVSATGVTEFFATIEQPTTKTAIAADGKVSWKAGDGITVTDAASKSAVYVAGSGGASTTFTLKTGGTPVGDGPYTATYGDIDNQIYDAAGANCPLTAPETSTTTFSFASPYAVVKITAKSDGGEVIKSVGVSYGGNDYTLNCGDGVTLTSDGNDFYVAVEPATDAALSVTFHTDGKTATKTRKSAVTLVAKDLLPVTFTFVAGDWEGPEDNTPPVALSGVFTVSDSSTPNDPSDDVKVSFSQGNLRYVVKTKKWSFYKHQYDFCNTMTYSGHHSDTVSLFSWGYNAEKSIIPNGQAIDNVSRTSGNLDQTEDWGSQIGDGKTWRTLTLSEWEYMLSKRSAATVGSTSNARYVTAKVNGIAGMILLPDDYKHPSGLTDLSSINSSTVTFAGNTYDLTAWEAMESAGAVFLPATGARGSGTNIIECDKWGCYWSSSAKDGSYAYRGVSFGSTNYVSYGTNAYGTRDGGHSVRLVTVVAAPEPTEPTEPEEPEEIEITKGKIGEHAYIGIGKVKWATQNLAITESGNMKWKGGNTGENPEVKVPGTNDDVIVGDYFQWATHSGYCGSEDGSDKGLLIYDSFTHNCCVGEDTKREFNFKAVNSNNWIPFYFFETKTTDSGGSHRGKSPYYNNGYTRYSNTPGHSDNRTVLEQADDVAHILWGDTWRMPTNEEFQSLYNATFWAWDATDIGYYVFLPADAGQSNGGTRGEIGTLDKSKALLFFPCSGCGSNTILSGNGYYWQSTLHDTGNAKYMSLISNRVEFSYLARHCGCSVRPVSD